MPIVVLFWFSSAPYPALAAVSEAELAECASIQEDGRRLACFDRLAARLEEGGGHGGWELDRRVSSLGAESGIALRLRADRPIPLRRGTYTPVLNIECASAGVSSVFIDVGVELDLTRVGRDGKKYYSVTLRYDQQAPQTLELRGLENGERLYFPEPETRLTSILAHGQLLIEVTPFSRSPVATRFSLAGLENRLQDVRENCGR